MPFTYLWPDSLVPKPAEWGPHIELANFINYAQAQAYEPPPALLDFLSAQEFADKLAKDLRRLRKNPKT